MASLLLHPNDPLWRLPRPGDLVALLRDLGLLDAEGRLDDPSVYLAGDRFLQLLVFLGCAPQVVLRPDDTGDAQGMCSVRLLAFDTPVFLAANPLPNVRCAGCRAPASLEPGCSFDTRYRCGQCGDTVLAGDLDWRRGAGYGCLFVEVRGIHPQEALPSDKLLQELGRFSRRNWKYFFATL